MIKIPSFLKSGSFKKDTIVGINVGIASVKIAVFRRGPAGLEPVQTDLREIDPALERAAHDEAIVSALKSLLKSVKSSSALFVATVNCPHTAVRRIQAPRIPKNELQEAVRLHASEYFPFPVNGSHLDLEQLAGNGDDHALVAVAPDATVRRMMDLAERVGIRLSALVPTPLAIARSIDLNDQTTAILDIGHSLTELVIVKRGQVLFSRTIPVAGKDFTQSLTVGLATEKGRVELSLAEAERIKCSTGLPLENEAPRVIEDKITTMQILSLLRASVELLSNEVERCFDYYREESAGGRIDRIELFGGGAGLKGLDRILSAGLGIEARVGPDPRVEAAAGAARSYAMGQTINLLPVEIKEKTKRTFTRATVLSAAASVILFLIFIYAAMVIQLNNAKTRAATAGLELASLKPQLEEAGQRRLTAELLRDQPYWDDVLSEIARAVPSGVVLTQMRFQDKTFFFGGSVNQGDRQAQMSRFIQNLEAGSFAKVRLVSARDGAQEDNRFEIRGGMDAWS